MSIILPLQGQRSEGSQFKARLGKKLLKALLNKRPGMLAHACNHCFLGVVGRIMI
jgi:hypothetical protein